MVYLFFNITFVSTPYSVMIMQRCEDYWGPDANVFDPERFLDERVKYLTKNPFVFIPFNGGKGAILACLSAN